MAVTFIRKKNARESADKLIWLRNPGRMIRVIVSSVDYSVLEFFLKLLFNKTIVSNTPSTGPTQIE